VDVEKHFGVFPIRGYSNTINDHVNNEYSHQESWMQDRTGGQMRVCVDDYFLAYTDGKREQEIHLAEPTPLSDVLSSMHIQAWENPTVAINGQNCTELAMLVADQDEVNISGGR
jgi:hypothetical protein